jgi:cytochrome c peroxidase
MTTVVRRALVACLAAIGAALAATPNEVDDASLRRLFARPTGILEPAENLQSEAKIALGARLFHEARLSANGQIACATCHNPKLGLADGVDRSAAGATAARLPRHTPALWNLAWAPQLHWDGRATSLEDQARLPMSHPDEMASSPAAAAERLRSDETYRQAFAAAFPDDPAIDALKLVKALASYERTLVSPPTRFDRWVAGEESALSDEELRGLRLFAGRGGCIGCHSGFAFTDYSFHDIGLPGDDLGRGPIIDVRAADHAFKTSGLRELAWTAPYMHDGSLATLEDVIRHYERGGIARTSRSKDLPSPFRLSDDERRDLVAFLESLSSEQPPQPSNEPWIRTRAPAAEAAAPTGNLVSQRNKMFAPGRIRIGRDQALTIVNDDTRTHNIRVVDPRLRFNSGAQEPGESVIIRFGQTGTFEAHCGIHPTMRLRVEVE